jgi:hypothetical protein
LSALSNPGRSNFLSDRKKPLTTHRSIDLRPVPGHGAMRIVASVTAGDPGLVAASGQARWPPAATGQ